MLLLVFTLFELLGDILRNGVSALVVGEYLLNVTPYFLYYPIAPMSMLLAVLVTFGLLQRSNEITAIKATGISLYRIVIPVLLPRRWSPAPFSPPTSSISPTLISGRTSCATVSRASPRRPIFGPTASGLSASTPISTTTSSSIPDRDAFGGITVFQFDPKTFQITHRITAERARLVRSHGPMGV